MNRTQPDPASIPGTVDFRAAAARHWDVAVIGAGPAGGCAAQQAAVRGATVLLIDRQEFPRRKVCGCCVNQAALRVLQSIGLENLPQRLGAQPLRQFRLASRGRAAVVRLQQTVSISRQRLDAALISEAVNAGAEFLPGVQASVQRLPGAPRVELHLRRQGKTAVINAGAAVIAAGLGASCLPHDPGNPNHASRQSRVGAATVIGIASGDYEPGIIFMACEPGGYVGLVRLEDGRLNVAAALDPAEIKARGGVSEAVARILQRSGFPSIGDVSNGQWQGTARLTQHRQRVHGPGYLLAGDAAGYVEPFTGEGIAWALATGKAAAPLAVQMGQQTLADAGQRWASKYHQMVRRRQRLCWAISGMLRRPLLVGLSVAVLTRFPQLAHPLVRAMNAEYD